MAATARAQVNGQTRYAEQGDVKRTWDIGHDLASIEASPAFNKIKWDDAAGDGALGDVTRGGGATTATLTFREVDWRDNVYTTDDHQLRLVVDGSAAFTTVSTGTVDTNAVDSATPAAGVQELVVTPASGVVVFVLTNTVDETVNIRVIRETSEGPMQWNCVMATKRVIYAA